MGNEKDVTVVEETQFHLNSQLQHDQVQQDQVQQDQVQQDQVQQDQVQHNQVQHDQVQQIRYSRIRYSRIRYRRRSRRLCPKPHRNKHLLHHIYLLLVQDLQGLNW